MALNIDTADRLATEIVKANGKSLAGMNTTSMAADDVKKFFNSGTEILHLTCPASNTAAVTVTLTSKEAFDSGRLGDKVAVIPAGGTFMCSNLSPLNMGQIVVITAAAGVGDTVSATLIVPAAN